MARENKLATVIENATGHGLTMKVGNPQCLVRLVSLNKGENYTVRLRLDWTYQEFVLEGKSDAAMKYSISSDDCCDFERLTVKKSISQSGVFVVDCEMSGVSNCKVLAGHELGRSDKTYHSSRRATRFTAVAFSDPAHYCKTIPCGYCGRDWTRPTIDTPEGEY